MRKTLSIILKTVTTVLVALVVIIAILLVGMRIFGFRVYTVLSGSMEPNYHVGSLIYVKEVDTSTLKEGDVITFMLNDHTTATHRIVEVVPDGNDPNVLRFRTKGDANTMEDQTLVHYHNVIGKPVFTIPFMGYIANYIQQPPGIYVAIIVAAALVTLVFCADGVSEKKDKKKDGGAIEGKATESQTVEGQETAEQETVAQTVESGSDVSVGVKTQATSETEPVASPAESTPAETASKEEQ